jgi:MFS family permease
MPIAGKLTDEIGARVVIPVGILVALAGTAAYTQVGAHTSYVFLAAALFVIGLGLGATIVPAMAVAFAAVPQEAVGAASSAINIVQRVAGSIGTALLAVVLQRSIAGKGVSDGIGSLAGVSPAALADAFGTAFWLALALVAVALVPALLLPRIRERPT